MKPIFLGRFAGLTFSAERSTLLATILLWIVLASLTMGLFNLPLPKALAGALIAVTLHWFNVIAHQLGHSRAARQVGYPMTGVRLWELLGSDEYPADEPALPGAVHIRRALGGPLVSLILTVAAAIILIIVAPHGGTLALIAWFFFLENLLVFTIGSLMPLSFADGSTLLTWWGKR